MKENQPYSQFGERIKALRSQYMRTPAEVCSAIEIDEKRFSSFESGESRPSEDILVLIINHFGLEGDQADELWRLAGYRGKPSEDAYFGIDDEPMGQLPYEHVAIGLTISDPRVIYTDMVQVLANDFGVIMNFLQGAGSSSQPLAVARVGMSKDHARSIIKLLQKTLDEADRPRTPRQLKAPKDKDHK
jgi:transcriptional regulator with XRE-family HTH domain